jgi:integrase
MPRSTRTRIAPGIYDDATGRAAKVKVGTHPDCLERERRYPAGTSLRTIQRWQNETRTELEKQLETPAARGTFAADVLRYYDTGSFAELTHQEDRRRCLDVWVPIFRVRRRATIRSHEINAQLQAWRASGLSASTCSHRLDAITQLFAVLDGPAAANPARGCIRFRKPDPVARGVPLETIDRIIEAMHHSRNRARRGATVARVRLMRWTGARPAQIARLDPNTSFDLEHPTLPSVLIPRAKGGKAARVPLVMPEGVDAATAFLEARAAGSFNTALANRMIARACRSLEIPIITVYQLRHSVATALRSAGVAVEDVRDTLGHTSATTTAIYAPPVTAIQMAQFELLRRAPKEGTPDFQQQATA